MPAGALAFMAAAAPYVATGANMIGNLVGANKQSDANIHAAKRQFQWQRAWQREQLEYNSPKNQMLRFQEAGLNPNLMYGQGSPGNWEGSASVPNIDAANYQAAYANIGTQVQQARLLSSQADLTEQKVQESGIKQELIKTQTAVLAANPYLNKQYVEAFVSQMESAAAIKKVELQYAPVEKQMNLSKIQQEVEVLSQKFNLGSVDAKIKAEILQSKEFQNYLNSLTKKWIEDGGVDGDSIRYGSLLLLQKFK